MLLDSYEPFDIDVGPFRLRGRPMTEADIPYVHHSWGIEASYFREHPRDHVRRAIDILLSDPTTVRLIVCDREQSDFIVGYLVASPGPGPVLHMAQVKGGFRGQGIARRMLALVGIEQGKAFGHTFRTRDLERSSRRGWDPILIPTFVNAGEGA